MGAGATHHHHPPPLLPKSPSNSVGEAEGSLVTVVYISHMVGHYFADLRSVSALVRFSAANNQSLGITGYLLVAVPFFLQRLEGPPHVLYHLLQGIKGDHRHDGLIVVEERGIGRRSYGDWAMKSFDAISSAGDRFDAVAFMLQALSVALQVANHTLHPALFERLLGGAEGPPEDSLGPAFVVTVALGPALLRTDPADHVVADLAALQAVARHLRKRVCSLNPEGRAPIALCAGSFLQVIVRISPHSRNLGNKVLRACTELVSGHGGVQPHDLFVAVETGDVHTAYLARPEDPRKGRYCYGAPLTRGLTVAKRLLQAEVQATLVVSQAVAVLLQEEFRMQPLVIGGFPMRSVKLYTTPAADQDHKYSPVDHMALSSDAAIAALLQMADAPTEPPGCPVRAEPSPTQAWTLPASPSPSEQVGDLEWIYGLEPPTDTDPLTPGKKKLRGIHGRAARRKMPRMDAAARLKTAPLPPTASLLNIVYVSMMAGPTPMTAAKVVELGEQCGRTNGEHGVTGFLLCTRPFFLQCLEGPPMDVKDVFLKIYRDPRHRNVTVLAFRHIRSRGFGTWPMRTMDLDADTAQDTGPLREVLLLLTRQFTNLQSWLTRLYHDLLLSWVHLRPMAHTQCTLVAFAALRRREVEGAPWGPALHALSPFLALGGEILGFVGDHLVGYTFAAAQAMLLDEVADLCAYGEVHVGVAAGPMLLVNTGDGGQHCDLAFYGPVFERARLLADQAAGLRVPIVAEPACQAPVHSLVWEPAGPVLIGRLDLEGARAAMAD